MSALTGYDGTDFYCDVALKGEVSLQKEYESEHVLAYHHTNPLYPFHVVVIPKKHIGFFATLTEEDGPTLMELIEAIKTIAKK